MTEGTRGRVVKGAAWMGAARIVVNATAFVSTILLARLLTPEDFGLVAIVTAVSAIVASVTELSLTQALIQGDEPTEDSFHSAWSLNLLRAVLLAVAMLALSVPVSQAYSEPRLVPVFAVMAAGTFIGSLENPKLVVFQRQLIFWRDFLVTIADKLVALVVALTIAIVYRSFWALVLGTVAAMIARVMLSYLLVPYRPRFRLARAKELLSFSLWLTLANLVKVINLRAVPLIIGAIMPTAAVGLYSLGERVATMPLRDTLGALQTTLFPAYARFRGDPDRLRAAYLRAQGAVCLFAFPVGFGIAAVAHPMVLGLLEQKWLAAVPVIQVIAASSAIMAVQNVLPLAMSIGRPAELLRRNVRSFIVQMPLLAGGVLIGLNTSLGELNGLLLGLGLSFAFNTLLNLGLVRKLIGLRLRDQLRVAARPFAASLVMVSVLATLPAIFPVARLDDGSLAGLAILILAGAFAFVASVWALWSLGGARGGAEGDLLELAWASLRAARRQIPLLDDARK